MLLLFSNAFLQGRPPRSREADAQKNDFPVQFFSEGSGMKKDPHETFLGEV